MKITSLGVYTQPGGLGLLNSNSIICSMSIYLDKFFFKSIFSRKNWRKGGDLSLKKSTVDGYAY